MSVTADPATVDSGVGRTALMVAAARAIETHRAAPLARDPYAEHFVRAAEASADWPIHPRDVSDDDPLWGRLGRYFAVRTRVFDDFLQRTGMPQVVLLGAGLDSRALRLDWPATRTVFELDREPVLSFKQRVLDDLAAHPRATRVPVPTDLTGDWVPALAAAGFDPRLPTAWLAEGLFMYLPAAAERRLVDEVDRLSAPGSHLAFETKPRPTAPAVLAHRVYTATRTRIGVDLPALFHPDPRPDTTADLTTRGWTTTTHTPFDHGLTREPDDPLTDNRWVFARQHGGR